QVDRYRVRAGTLTIGKAGGEPGTTPGNCGAIRGSLPGFTGDCHTHGTRGCGSGVALISGAAETGNVGGGAGRDISSAASGEYRRECSLHSGASTSVLSGALPERGGLSGGGRRV